ncbi:PREDICTED: probable plastid-lipid-associated protein 4, chloroplastic isoform X2 [Nicotiana attenuata]|uniref:probable plastid-lipid-associated protein 4, chloroplastic isoform X2 n=1 Tax=Nicotiana attenuata TaxID=49451 RepID=UPI0009050A78|nr:PREDICTED: probable plastid-lipid-associated protein 4, chloroplastic isoform X2 [Nicotiana attenuata]
MATLCLSSSSSVKLKEISTFHSFPTNANFSSKTFCKNLPVNHAPYCERRLEQVRESWKWRTKVSFFPFFSTKSKDIESLKLELFEAIAPLDRGAEATTEDQKLVDQIVSKLEAANKVKEPLKSGLLNGKWELLYTTSQSILQTKRLKILRPTGKIYQAINADTLRAQNMETWPFFNQATANLVPLNERRVAVKFDSFKIAGLVDTHKKPWKWSWST